MSPTVDTVVAEFEQALLENDFVTMAGIYASLLTMMLSAEGDVAQSARETAEAVLILREAHQAIDQ